MGALKIVLLFAFLCVCVVDVNSILLDKNAYSGVSISFSDQVQQQHFDVEKLKKVLIKASELLFHATRKRAYYESFTLVVPAHWTNDFCSETLEDSESPQMVNVYVTNFMDNSTLRAQHSKGCGFEGDVIYLPLDALNGDTEELARQFVQQWSIYRYGVFEESSLEEAACYASSKGEWSPVGCYNVKIQSKPIFSKDGLPYCSIDENISLPNMRSSLMSDFSRALDFCDGSPEFPHNPVMPTLHNNLCEGKTVWSVIENSEDFRHGKNLPVDFNKPPIPSFKCFQESVIQLTLAIQICSTNDTTYVVQELRYTFFHFLKNIIPTDMKINLVTFCEEIGVSVELNSKNEEKLREELDKYVATPKLSKKICLLCGLQEAMNVSQPNPYSTVVFVVWESDFINLKSSEIIESMKERVKLHLLLVKDTDKNAIQPELMMAIRSTGGFIHILPKPFTIQPMPNVLLNNQLYVILSSVLASPLQVDEEILMIHDEKYTNGTEILDTFRTPTGMKGKLLYMMHCDLKGQIDFWDPDCTRWDAKSTTFLCGNVQELNDGLNKTWQYKFVIQKGVGIPICASNALLFKSSSASDSFSLRGWLNEYVINPGENALIIYAEILNRLPNKVYEVLAYISGPGMEIPFEIELWDNGNGDPDVKFGDGIYSRYFSSFKEKGSYTVTMTARVSNTLMTNIVQNGEYSDNFETKQKKVIGSFYVLNKPPEIDFIPPNRIADLKVIGIDHENSSVTLQWTAPGNDYDFGQATKYEIRYALHPGILQDLYFESEGTSELEEMNNPQSCGQLEKQMFKMPKANRSTIYNIALRALDANNNKGKISNIVQLYMTESNTVITQPDETTTEHESSVSVSVSISDVTITESFTFDPNSTDDTNTTNIPTEQPSQNFIFDEKYIILVSAVGAVILLIIILNIIVCCCCWKTKSKKQEKSKKLSRKSSSKPPYTVNIAYQEDAQSLSQSEVDISITNLEDQNSYSTPSTKFDSSPNYSYHTSKSLLNRSKSKPDPELGFRVVETAPVYATSSLSRFARRLNNSDDGQIKSSAAQPQQPSNSNETQVYSLGEV